MDRPLEIEELLGHAGWLRRLAESLVRDGASADDLVQETWMAALRHPPRSHPRPWLARVMRNLVRTERRRSASRTAREELAREERTSLPPEEILQEAEAQRLLAESVTKLAEPLRVVIVLHYFRGLDSSAIARELSLSSSAVRTRLQKAQAELRTHLDRHVEGGRRAWSLALGAIVRGARTGGSAGAGSVAGSAVATVAPSSTPAAAWVAGSLLLLGGLAAWKLAGNEPQPMLEAMALDARAPRGSVAGGLSETSGELVPHEAEPELEPAMVHVLETSQRRVVEAVEVEATSRGRLVDKATLEPIPDALVATSKRNDWTDSNGWFDTGDLLDGLDDLLVVNYGDYSNKSEIPKASWTRMRYAWQIPLAIGPTFRLRFRDADVPHPERWEARLMRDSDSDGVWRGLHKGSPPYFRFGA